MPRYHLYLRIYFLLSASLNALTERNTVPPTLSKHFPCHYFIPIVGCSTVYLQGDSLRAKCRALHQTARSLSNLYPQSCPYSNVFVYCRIHFTKLYAAWQAILKTYAVFAHILPIQQPQQKNTADWHWRKRLCDVFCVFSLSGGLLLPFGKLPRCHCATCAITQLPLWSLFLRLAFCCRCCKGC